MINMSGVTIQITIDYICIIQKIVKAMSFITYKLL